MMRPATTHERLEELGRRIDALATRTQAETEQTRLGSQDRVAALRKAQAAARATVHDAAASAEEAMLQLDARVTIAERSAATDSAEDLATFVDTATEELRGWDVYLERWQVKVATTAGDDRDQAEEVIRQLRQHRNALGAGVAELTCTSGNAWRKTREQLRSARDELEVGAAALEGSRV
jgi:hypothetical protein